MSKRVAVLGTGANGSCTAADLMRTGHDVTLIDQWPAHVEAMRKDGLTIEMPDERLHVRVNAHHLCDVCTFTEKFDVVLLYVKAYDTRWSAEFIRPYLAPDGLLVGVQNAMMAGDIAEVVGPERTLGCVVELSSEIFTPGLVQRNTTRDHTWFGLGALDPSMTERIGEVEALLRHVGKVSVTEDIFSAKWMKLVVNTMCLGPIAMLGVTLSEALAMPGMRDLLQRIGEEALVAGQDRGHTIQPIFGLRPEDVEGTNRLLEKLLDKLAADIGPRARDCTLQDHLKGRLSEVDLINGLVVEESRRRGREAPANAMVVEISRRIHTGELKPEPANLAIAQSLIAGQGEPTGGRP